LKSSSLTMRMPRGARGATTNRTGFASLEAATLLLAHGLKDGLGGVVVDLKNEVLEAWRTSPFGLRSVVSLIALFNIGILCLLVVWWFGPCVSKKSTAKAGVTFTSTLSRGASRNDMLTQSASSASTAKSTRSTGKLMRSLPTSAMREARSGSGPKMSAAESSSSQASPRGRAQTSQSTTGWKATGGRSL